MDKKQLLLCAELFEMCLKYFCIPHSYLLIGKIFLLYSHLRDIRSFLSRVCAEYIETK